MTVDPAQLVERSIDGAKLATAPELGLLADALAVAASRLIGPLKEADHTPALDVAAHLLVERITGDLDLMVALSTVRALRYEGRRE